MPVNADKPHLWKPDIAQSEEAIKFAQLRSNYGSNVRYILFLCGYFDSGYLG